MSSCEVLAEVSSHFDSGPFDIYINAFCLVVYSSGLNCLKAKDRRMEYASTPAWGAGASTSQSRFSSSSSAGGHVAEQAKLDFEQAMQDFQTMFPDMDRDLIEQVLRANNGAVERTIDELLALNSQPGATLTVNVSTSSSETAPAVPPRPLRRKRWNPPLVGPLPEGFLR